MWGLVPPNRICAPGLTVDNDVTPLSPSTQVMVRNCSRLGMQATPPKPMFSFGWFRRR